MPTQLLWHDIALRLAMSMPLRNARQALATSKFWQVLGRRRLPETMEAVDGSR